MINSKGKASANSISLDYFLEIGRQASGLNDELEILKWYGLNRSAINNCRQRGHVPFSTLIPALLGKQMSIDWMLQPEGGLQVPDYVVAQSVVAESGRYNSGTDTQSECSQVRQTSTNEFGAATSYFYALLTRHQAKASAENLQLLWSVYRVFPNASELRTQVLEALAATLAGQDQARAAAQQR